MGWKRARCGQGGGLPLPISLRAKHKKPATLARAGFLQSEAAQYRRWRLVTSRDTRRAWRFTAAAALRLRSWVGFS